MSVLQLPAPLHRLLEARLRHLLQPPGVPADWFAQPAGEPALVGADSMAWQLFKNPVALFVGGVAAVVLELAEPRVRSGVWEHTSFRERPVQRLQRTGMAAMMTVYGPRSRSEAMIAAVARLHARIAGVTPDGIPYRGDEPELLDWVHATATFGLLEATHAYVRPLPRADRDRYFREGRRAADLYGARGSPVSQAAMDTLMERMRGRLEASPIVPEFLRILGHAPALPAPMRPLQRLLIRAGVQVTPPWLRAQLGLQCWELARWERPLVRALARGADRLLLRSSPAVLACRRLGLAEDYLYRPRPAG